MYSKILVALDGSEFSASSGHIALTIALGMGAEILACHVYDAHIHRKRFHEMEPGLPTRYQGEESLLHLRKTHDELISDGLRALSEGYMDHFLENARQAGVAGTELNVEGRNYTKILEIASERKPDLVVLGAYGLGTLGNGMLGSTAARVLRRATCDVLIARHSLGNGGILVGIDGSDHALEALRTGAILGRTLKKPLCLAAAYDPFFHLDVFKSISHSVSEERQREVGIVRQENLHEAFIDEALGALYKSFLDRAYKEAGIMEMEVSSALLRGKAYQALAEYAERTRPDLLAVGRYGYHREEISEIGFTVEALAQLSSTNILIVAPKREKRQ